ncbi:MAG: OsmC family protein, partial [Candidatus Aminicenantales bacterium]
GLGVIMTTERGEVSKMVDKISIAVTPPAGFPEKYRDALVKSVDHCTVKAHILRPPRFEVVLRP